MLEIMLLVMKYWKGEGDKIFDRRKERKVGITPTHLYCVSTCSCVWQSALSNLCTIRWFDTFGLSVEYLNSLFIRHDMTKHSHKPVYFIHKIKSVTLRNLNRTIDGLPWCLPCVNYRCYLHDVSNNTILKSFREETFYYDYRKNSPLNKLHLL